MIDARTIQALVDRAEAERRATPVLTRAQLDRAIAATRPAAPVEADANTIRDAFQVVYDAGRQRGHKEGIAVTTPVAIAVGRRLERNNR